MPRVQLCGQVTSNGYARIYRLFGFDVCCPNDVRQAVENCPDGEELVFELNSSGGSVYAGFEMYNIIRNSGKKTRAEVYSIAASATGVIMCACDTVLMSPVSNFMMHRSAIDGGYGNAEKMGQTKQMLDTIDESIVNAYVEKAGGKTSATEFRRKMKNETFMTAQETIECGLADGLIEKSSAEPEPSLMSAVASMDLGIEQNNMLSVYVALARNNLPSIEDLQRIMEKKNTLNTEPEANESGDVQNIKQIAEEGEKMEITSKEGLVKAFPEFVAQIQEDACAAERERISGIDAVALPGFEEIIRKAKADPKQNGGTVATAIIMAQKEQGNAYIASARADAKLSKANEVRGESKLDGVQDRTGEEDVVQAAKEAMAQWKEGKK